MKSLIWNWPSRVFHLLLTVAIITVFLTGEEDSWRSLHIAAGSFAAVLIIFRLVYGFIGPKYSHFRDFTFNPIKIMDYFTTYFSKAKTYAGHNPAASVVMALIFLFGLASSLTGFILYGIENNTLNIALSEDAIKDLHEGIAHLFLGLIVMHLIGAIADAIFHKKSGTLFSIFNGYKNIEAEESKLSGLHKVFAIVWFLVPFICFYLAFNLPITESKEKDKDKIEKAEDSD